MNKYIIYGMLNSTNFIPHIYRGSFEGVKKFCVDINKNRRWDYITFELINNE